MGKHGEWKELQSQLENLPQINAELQQAFAQIGVVWCGVVWCGVVWCGVVWCGVVWCGVVWCGVAMCSIDNA